MISLGSYFSIFSLQMTTSEHVQMRDPNYSNICTIKSCTFAGPKYMLTGSDDWNIYVWKMPTEWGKYGGNQNDEEDEEAPVIENAYTVLRGHRSIVNHVKFGERSSMLLSCGVEKIVKVKIIFIFFNFLLFFSVGAHLNYSTHTRHQSKGKGCQIHDFIHISKCLIHMLIQVKYFFAL